METIGIYNTYYNGATNNPHPPLSTRKIYLLHCRVPSQVLPSSPARAISTPMLPNSQGYLIRVSLRFTSISRHLNGVRYQTRTVIV